MGLLSDAYTPPQWNPMASAQSNAVTRSAGSVRNTQVPVGFASLHTNLESMLAKPIGGAGGVVGLRRICGKSQPLSLDTRIVKSEGVLPAGLCRSAVSSRS